MFKYTIVPLEKRWQTEKKTLIYISGETGLLDSKYILIGDEICLGAIFLLPCS